MKLKALNFVTADFGPFFRWNWPFRFCDGRLLHIRDRSSCPFRAPGWTVQSGDSPGKVFWHSYVFMKCTFWKIRPYQYYWRHISQSFHSDRIIRTIFCSFHRCRVEILHGPNTTSWRNLKKICNFFYIILRQGIRHMILKNILSYIMKKVISVSLWSNLSMNFKWDKFTYFHKVSCAILWEF